MHMLLLSALLVGCSDQAGDTGAEACGGPGVICTFAGTGTAGLGGESQLAVESHLYLPQDLTFGPDGKAYIMDWNNHRIRSIDADGMIDTVAGTGFLGDGPEGPAMSAAFNHPTNLAFDPTGGAIIAAWHNSRIERLDLQAGTLDFTCGTGGRGYNGSGIPAMDAILDLPSSVAIDDQGRVWISDQANQLIRYVEDDVIYDAAGGQRIAGYGGDGGPGSEALFHASVGQAADPSSKMEIDGNTMYIADTGNNLVRTMDLTSFQVDRLAGTPPDCDETGVECTQNNGYEGDGGDALSARLYGPTDVAVGLDGEVYVADTQNSCVRVITPDGKIDTFAGVCGMQGYEGDGLAANEALLNRPYGVSTDAQGNVYIADTYNHVFRVVYR